METIIAAIITAAGAIIAAIITSRGSERPQPQKQNTQTQRQPSQPQKSLDSATVVHVIYKIVAFLVLIGAGITLSIATGVFLFNAQYNCLGIDCNLDFNLGFELAFPVFLGGVIASGIGKALWRRNAYSIICFAVAATSTFFSSMFFIFAEDVTDGEQMTNIIFLLTGILLFPALGFYLRKQGW